MSALRHCDRCGAQLTGARCENCAPPPSLVHPDATATTTDELEIDRLRDQVAKLEKLRDELCTAENGGPSRALAIITLGQALKEKSALETELARVRKVVRHFLESGQAENIHILWEQRLREVFEPKPKPPAGTPA